ncbi:hypothetical protein COCON_G00114340 [Conger conger]|uniref:Uncharacterized protein n=1 Tax=Conger conger TaxID=82655 RepID=A0A9Q1HY50_CONCO|nr:hypothetical protein COCON_G00114340 [Conger conger]
MAESECSACFAPRRIRSLLRISRTMRFPTCFLLCLEARGHVLLPARHLLRCERIQTVPKTTIWLISTSAQPRCGEREGRRRRGEKLRDGTKRNGREKERPTPLFRSRQAAYADLRSLHPPTLCRLSVGGVGGHTRRPGGPGPGPCGGVCECPGLLSLPPRPGPLNVISGSQRRREGHRGGAGWAVEKGDASLAAVL